MVAIAETQYTLIFVFSEMPASVPYIQLRFCSHEQMMYAIDKCKDHSGFIEIETIDPLPTLINRNKLLTITTPQS